MSRLLPITPTEADGTTDTDSATETDWPTETDNWIGADSRIDGLIERDEPAGTPTLSELTDQSAAEWSVREIRTAARAALQIHAPDRQPLTRIKRWGLPWLLRNHAECRQCGAAYPCITHRYATQLLSAGRLPAGRPAADKNDDHGNEFRDPA
jgi:hypothetical protein